MKNKKELKKVNIRNQKRKQEVIKQRREERAFTLKYINNKKSRK